MADKNLDDLTEIMALDPDDLLLVETVGGNSRKIKKKNISVEGRVQPVIVQSATLRGDGTIALPVAPTPGNLMVLVMAGYSATSLPTIYKPAAFTSVVTYQSDTNNAVSFAVRRVVSGDTGSYAMSTSDNQAAVLYEVENCAGAFALTGGAMAGSFSGANYSYTGQQSPYGVNDLIVGAFTQDTAATWALTPETGLTVDFLTPNDGANHTGAFFHYDKTFDGIMTGSTSANPTAPASGLAALVGSAG